MTEAAAPAAAFLGWWEHTAVVRFGCFVFQLS